MTFHACILEANRVLLPLISGIFPVAFTDNLIPPFIEKHHMILPHFLPRENAGTFRFRQLLDCGGVKFRLGHLCRPSGIVEEGECGNNDEYDYPNYDLPFIIDLRRFIETGLLETVDDLFFLLRHPYPSLLSNAYVLILLYITQASTTFSRCFRGLVFICFFRFKFLERP